MNKDKKIIAIYILSLCGVLFSGYLSAVKFFTNTCALGITCPVFLGIPACYFGFAMFLLLLILSAMILWGKINIKKGLIEVVELSVLGVIFAGYYTFREITVLFTQGPSTYFSSLPVCAFGFIFFAAVCVLSSIGLKKA